MMAVVVLKAYVVISDDEDNGDNEKDGNGWPAIPKMEMTEMSRTLYQQYCSTKDANEDRNVTYPVPAVRQYKSCR